MFGHWSTMTLRSYFKSQTKLRLVATVQSRWMHHVVVRAVCSALAPPDQEVTLFLCDVNPTLVSAVILRRPSRSAMICEECADWILNSKHIRVTYTTVEDV